MGLGGDFWRRTILPLSATIAQAINNLNEFSMKIVLVADEDGILDGTISDGDIRRGLLKGLDLKDSLSSIVHRNPLVVPPELSRDLVLQLMISNKVQQIPVVGKNQLLLGLHLWEEITAPKARQNLMVIMAGGVGTRLLPHTENCPKPLLLVAGKPMLEHIIGRAKLEGFNQFVIAVGYLGHMIESHLGNGERLGVRIEYLNEEQPLGTAGALSLFNPAPHNPFIVTNGDVITDIRYGDLLDFHIRNSAVATMAVRLHEWQNPFGVVRTEGIEIIGFEEKPIFRSHINAGVYALNPEALSLLMLNNHCDMPALFEKIQSAGNSIVAYPMHEPWMDVGRPEDLRFLNANQ